jgi:anti-sigma regulatory factor (Ser/Thr protein kinase)
MRPNLELLVSELVSNVVRHSGLGPQETMEVHVHMEPKHVRVEVRDEGEGLARPIPLAEPKEPGTGGFGLLLVDRIATRWGTESDHGTTVWFELEE